MPGKGEDVAEKILRMSPLAPKDAHVLDKQRKRVPRPEDFVFFNWAVCISWPLVSVFLLSQPWLSNWANNKWHAYSADYAVPSKRGLWEGTYQRSGLCTTPAHEMHCTNGENFTELALKYRGAPVGCGCGQGVLGEGLCPMTSYGHTLSDYVSTAPSLGALLGLGYFPLQGAWRTTEVINSKARPSVFVARWHWITLLGFQISYIAWGICSACVFPISHCVLTVLFLLFYLHHWLITGFICLAAWGFKAIEAKITFTVAMFDLVTLALGSIPRIFLTINDAVGVAIFPNWNRGIGSYAFWFAEAAGLSATFGLYPMMILAYCYPKLSANKPMQFRLFYETSTVAGKDD